MKVNLESQLYWLVTLSGMIRLYGNEPNKEERKDLAEIVQSEALQTVMTITEAAERWGKGPHPPYVMHIMVM